MSNKHVLTRELMAAGGVAAMIAREAPGMRILSDEERAASLAETLACRPEGPVWLFAYGSLIWNPTIQSLESRVVHVRGWHRAFCLSTRAGRGSPDNPGLVLGLDEGGACTGVAYRVAEDILEAELELLWRREMVAGSYIPSWLEAEDADGNPAGPVLAFIMNHDSEQYAGCLERAEIIRRLATAAGTLGSAADYLYQTCDGLRLNGIPDADLEMLEVEVRQEQARGDTE